MEQKNITLTIDNKLHKLTDFYQPCEECSLHDDCIGTSFVRCPAIALGGESFVELKVEK